MSIAELVGYVGGACTTIAFIPQVLLVWKTRSTKDISLGMYSIYVFGIALWLAYGIMANAWPVILPNVVTLVFSGVILCMKIANDSRAACRPRA